jgi:hypothetical protein
MALQEDALTAAGYTKIFRDVFSGSTTERPDLMNAMVYPHWADAWWSDIDESEYGTIANYLSQFTRRLDT